MKDVALDDLIKEDKQKAKLKRRTPPTRVTKSFMQGKKNGRRIINKRVNSNFRSQQKNQNFNNKRRPINRPNPRNERNPTANRRLPLKRKPLNKPKDAENGEKKNIEKGRTLKVLGLHPDVTNEELYKLFSAEGTLEKCLIELDDFGRQLTTALVKYTNASAAEQAMSKFKNYKLNNSVLTVEPYKRSKN